MFKKNRAFSFFEAEEQISDINKWYPIGCRTCRIYSFSDTDFLPRKQFFLLEGRFYWIPIKYQRQYYRGITTLKTRVKKSEDFPQNRAPFRPNRIDYRKSTTPPFHKKPPWGSSENSVATSQ
jgi:hypothetical protein